MSEEMVVGYQFNPVNGEFMGEYRFPNNKDKDSIHVPPNTTLTPPPSESSQGERPFWDGEQWVLKADASVVVIKSNSPVDVSKLGEYDGAYIEGLVNAGVLPASIIGEWESAHAVYVEALHQQQKEAMLQMTTNIGG